MKALVLASGFCTRLFPLTEKYPKALFTIGGKEILDFLLTDIFSCPQIEEIALITNHRYVGIFSDWIGKKYRREIPLIDNGVVSPENRLGAIGDLVYALDTLRWQDDVLVLASDTLTSMKMADFIAFTNTHHTFVNAVYDTHDREVIRKKLGCVGIQGDKIVEFTEKPDEPKTTLTSIPYYFYAKDIIPLIAEYKKTGGSLDAPGSIVPWLLTKTSCYAYTLNQGYYYDVGTLEVYNNLKDGLKTL